MCYFTHHYVNKVPFLFISILFSCSCPFDLFLYFNIFSCFFSSLEKKLLQKKFSKIVFFFSNLVQGQYRSSTWSCWRCAQLGQAIFERYASHQSVSNRCIKLEEWYSMFDMCRTLLLYLQEMSVLLRLYCQTN